MKNEKPSDLEPNMNSYKSESDSDFIEFFSHILLRVLLLALYPFFFAIFGLAIIIGIPYLIWKNLTYSKKKELLKLEKAAEERRLSEEWKIHFQNEKYLIELYFEGSLPWDSAYYFYLRSTPPIPYLNDKIFGDWYVEDYNGVFLQLWTRIKNYRMDLVFISFDSLEAKILVSDIETFRWYSEKVSDTEIRFTFYYPGRSDYYMANKNDLMNIP